MADVLFTPFNQAQRIIKTNKIGIHVKRQKRAMNNSAAVSLINFYVLTTKVKELALRARIGDHSHVKLACKISTSKKPATQFALLLN